MELTKKDTQMIKGLAIIFMLLLHLFCKVDNLPYNCIKLSNGTPLVYYFGLMGDCCVAIYCFCSGYAHYLICEKTKSAKDYYRGRFKGLLLFLINYWVVLILFSIIGLIIKSEQMPGSFLTFLKSFFLLDKSYNGAWWFVLTYVILVLISRLCFKISKNINTFFVLVAVILVYLVAYYQRIKVVVVTDYATLNWVITQLALLGTSLLPYYFGMLFFKHSIFTKIRFYIDKNMNNIVVTMLAAVIFVVMCIGHIIVKSLIVAPFIGVVIIVLFSVVKKSKMVDGFFAFMGKHSTNMWLTHLFFINVIFEDLVFVARYPIFIFLFMLILTIGSSYIINLVYKPICKLVK